MCARGCGEEYIEGVGLVIKVNLGPHRMPSFLCVCARYFGSAEGSKFVEEASVNNVKRTWVNYGIERDWTHPQQGQVYY